MPTCPAEQSTSFYEALQANVELDLRDPRGKLHDLPLVLLSLTLSSCSAVEMAAYLVSTEACSIRKRFYVPFWASGNAW